MCFLCGYMHVSEFRCLQRLEVSGLEQQISGYDSMVLRAKPRSSGTAASAFNLRAISRTPKIIS